MATQEPYRDMSQGSSKRSIFDRWRESRNKPPSNESFLKRASNWWYQPIKYVLERAGFFVYAVVIFLVIAVVIFGGWNWISGAGAGQVAASELDIAAEKGGVWGSIAAGIQNARDFVFKPEKFTSDYGFESEIEQYAGMEDLGVKVNNFKVIGGRIYENQPIYLGGTISVVGFKENIDVTVFCSLDDGRTEAQYMASNMGLYPGVEQPDDIKLIPAVLEGAGVKGNTATFYPGSSNMMYASCYFPLGVDTTKALKSVEARLYVLFNYVTTASMKMYFLGQETLMPILMNGDDPFEKLMIIEPNLKFDNTVSSRTSGGPVNIGLGTYVSQPFSEGMSVPFGVTIKPNSAVASGNLQRLDSLELHMPIFTYLESDLEYRAGQATGSLIDLCDFVNSFDISNEGSKIYTLKAEKLDEANNKCNKEFLQSASLTKLQCMNLYWKNLDFRCKFKTMRDQSVPEMEFDFMRIVARYKFQVEMPTAVTVWMDPSEAQQQEHFIDDVEDYLLK